MLKGIDISYWQGQPNFSSLAQNQDFIVIRSSYGTGYRDTKFDYNREQCRIKNIPHGFYHYAYPTYNTPEDEARWFVSVVSPLESGEFLCLDFEEKYQTPVDWCKRFLDTVSELLGGYKPLIYLNKYTVQSYDWNPVVSKGYGLWLSYWDYNPDGTFNIPYWNIVAMRQYSNKEIVNGISGGVDANVFYGEKEQLQSYGIQIGDIPCEKLKSENEQLKLEIKSITKEKDGLVKSLSDLNTLYKNLLAEDKIEDAQLAELIEDFNELTEQYKLESDKVFEKDKEILTITGNNDKLSAEITRLKLQKFTFGESLTFLIRAIRGGESA